MTVQEQLLTQTRLLPNRPFQRSQDRQCRQCRQHRQHRQRRKRIIRGRKERRIRGRKEKRIRKKKTRINRKRTIHSNRSVIESKSRTSSELTTQSQIQTRQALFDAFLAKQDAIQRDCVDNGRIVVYKIHKESGLGNMIRGYLTAFVVAILTNRGVQGKHASQPSPTVKAPREFFFKFFTPPFPNMSGRNSGDASRAL